MPTGHTAPIVDGENVTLQEFALDCSKSLVMAMGTHTEGSLRLPSYKPVEDARQDLVKTLKMDLDWYHATEEERYALWSEYVERVEKQNQSQAEGKKVVLERLQAMRNQVEAWNAPDVNQPLKQFMLDQLDLTIEHDGKPFFLEPLGYVEWCDKETDYLKRRVRNDRERFVNQRKMYEDRTRWVLALSDSLNIKVAGLDE